MTFAEALKMAEAWVETVDGVEGVAEGLTGEEPCITVFVSSSEPSTRLPNALGHWKIVLEGGRLRRPRAGG